MPEVSDVNLEASNSQDHNAMDISNISSSANEESSINSSEMTENITALPVPKNLQPLPQDRRYLQNYYAEKLNS